VILPTAPFAEESGTGTNTNRQVQLAARPCRRRATRKNGLVDRLSNWRNESGGWGGTYNPNRARFSPREA